MGIYQIQLEHQWRPAYAAIEGSAVRSHTPCIVRHENGECFGEVIQDREGSVPCLQAFQKLAFIRLATREDIERRERQRKLEAEAFAYCREQAAELKLAMKLVRVMFPFDEQKLVFVYTAENKVDFRELVRVLARRFQIRVEMRQIGVRDEARMRGGFGHCGQPLCCARFLRQFAPVTIRMAKDQGLSLNPAKISGLCGRLMCCLRYEAPAKKPENHSQGDE